MSGPRSWPHRDLLPSMRKLARAFAAVGFPIVSNPARSFWKLSDAPVRERIRHFQSSCTAARVGQLEANGVVDLPTMSTLLYLLQQSPATAREVFEVGS